MPSPLPNKRPQRTAVFPAPPPIPGLQSTRPVSSAQFRCLSSLPPPMVRCLVHIRQPPATAPNFKPSQAFGPLTPKSKMFEQIEPKASLSWRPNSGTNVYANWGIGFKSGGFNNQGSSAIINTNFNVPAIAAGVTVPDQYDKEVSSAFEAGIKGSLLGNRTMFDLAGYYTRITDMQFFEFFVGFFSDCCGPYPISTR
jgi:outer membrane receptor protein involved in Fe transport